MPPRFSLRRLFLLIIGFGFCVIVITNVKQNWTLWPGYQEETTTDITVSQLAHKESKEVIETAKVETELQITQTVLEKPWFMKGGTLRPSPASKNR